MVRSQQLGSAGDPAHASYERIGHIAWDLACGSGDPGIAAEIVVLAWREHSSGGGAWNDDLRLLRRVRALVAERRGAVEWPSGPLPDELQELLDYSFMARMSVDAIAALMGVPRVSVVEGIRAGVARASAVVAVAT